MQIIDADGHFTPILSKIGNPSVDSWIDGYLARKQGMFSDADNRELELHMLGVDRQLLNPMGPSLELFYSIDKNIARHIMRIYNDTMYDLSQRFTCFDINIWLALQDLDASLEELDRFQDRKFFGVHVSETPLWGFISGLDPLWQKLSQRGIPWYMHLTNTHDDLPADDLEPEFQTCEQHWKDDRWKASIASLILGGVLDRYPNLKVVIVERDIDWVRDFVSDLKKLYQVDALPYIKKNFWFTTEPEMPKFIDHADYVGFDRLLFATDWPHDMDIGGSNSRQDVETVDHLPINESQKSQIFYENYLTISNKIQYKS